MNCLSTDPGRRRPGLIATFALVAILSAPPDWLGVDKLKHFLMSAFVQSTTFSAARAAGMTRSNAQVVAGVSTVSVGVWKEIVDLRRGRPFGVADLAWDVAGGAAAASLLNGTR